MSPDDKFRITAGVDQRSSILKLEASESDPDAGLVALGLKFDALSSELEALQKEQVDSRSAVVPRGDRLEGAPTISPLDQRIEAVLTLLYPIERAIMATPAITIVGLGVKARHAAQVLSHYWTELARKARLGCASSPPADKVDLHCRRRGIAVITAVRFEALTDERSRRDPPLERADRSCFPASGDQCLGFDNLHDDAIRRELRHFGEEFLSKPVRQRA